MRLTSRRSRWLGLRLALWLGVPLGLVQLFLGLVALLGKLDWLLCALLGALLYFALPALAGFRASGSHIYAAQLMEEGQTAGSHAGCLVGKISLLVVVIAGCVFSVLLFTYSSDPNPNGPFYHPLPVLGFIIYAMAFFFVILFNALGAVIAYFGGWVGGGLADRRASDPDQRGAGSEEPPPVS